MNVSANTLRNLVLGIGAYTVGRLVSTGIVFLLHVSVDQIFHFRDASRALAAAFDSSLPEAIGAAASGIVVAFLIDSPRPARWLLIPAAAWMLLLLGNALVQTPTWLDAAAQTLLAALPAITCIAAGRMALWHRDRRA